MKLYKEILTKTLETIINHYGKDQFADISTSSVCPRCSTTYLCFSCSDLILFKTASDDAWRVYGVREEEEELDAICDCAQE